MEQLSTAEILELMLVHEQFIDSQIEFWLTVTFATIVASFAGREYMTKTNRNIVGLLYLIATVVFISRWFYEAIDLGGYLVILADRGIEASPPIITAIFRLLLVVLGGFATIYFLAKNTEPDDA